MLCEAARKELGLKDLLVPRSTYLRADGRVAFVGEEGLMVGGSFDFMSNQVLLGPEIDALAASYRKKIAAGGGGITGEEALALTMLPPSGEPAASVQRRWTDGKFDLMSPVQTRRSICEFAELPDFFFSLGDFFSQGEAECPAGLDGDCRGFSQLSLLNSTHFGDQASKLYRYYHSLALETVASCASAAHATNQARFLLPADLASCVAAGFAYEGVALHHLQDRWSTGHMWQRWGSPILADFGNAEVALKVGFEAGMLHGADAVFRSLANPDTKDAMCAPGTKWGFPDGNERFPGVGDLYAAQLLQDRHYEVQRRFLLTCSAASMAELVPKEVRAFLGIRHAPAFDSRCLEPWATNGSLAHGFGLSGLAGNDTQQALDEFASLYFAAAPLMNVFSKSNFDDRFLQAHTGLALGLIAGSVARMDGLELARGDLPDFLGIKPGDHFLGKLPAPQHDESVVLRGGEDVSSYVARMIDRRSNGSFVAQQLPLPREFCAIKTAEQTFEATRQRCLSDPTDASLKLFGAPCSACLALLFERVEFVIPGLAPNDATICEKLGFPREERIRRCTADQDRCKSDPSRCFVLGDDSMEREACGVKNNAPIDPGSTATSDLAGCAGLGQ